MRFSNDGNDMYICQVCARDLDSVKYPPTWSKAVPSGAGVRAGNICPNCIAIGLQAMRALASLTPGGSEFYNDSNRCVEFVRSHQTSQMKVIVQFKKDRDKMKKALEEICYLSQVALNGTDKQYYEANRSDIATLANRALEQ